MITNQWYAVLSSHELKPNKVTAARRFGVNLVFFRDKDGTPAVSQTCAPIAGHRSERAAVKDGHIQCPFHGIEYDITGKCVHIPSEGRASETDFSRFNLKHYEVREIGDIIFVWYGDSDPDHEPRVFDIIKDRSYTYDHINDAWPVHYSRVIENQLDVSHLAFVHHNTIGRGNKTLVNGYGVDHHLQADRITAKQERIRELQAATIKGLR